MIRTKLCVEQERAILIAVRTQKNVWDDMQELSRLAHTAGAKVITAFFQKRFRAHPETYLGKGKVAQLKSLAHLEHIDVVIADDDLSPIQVRNLEKTLGVKVIDRSELILDIFATRARTKQAKLQVELAQLEYGLNRLRRLWTHLERQEGVSGGRVATRGPGEKQIEVDRRLARKRISELKKKLQDVERRANTSRRLREKVFKISLVGYTNAGKSTLMRQLTGENVVVEDKLFSTLDTLTRNLDGRWPECVLSDTVGFIRKLPKHLLSAFRSTLADVIESDLLLEVVDAADENADESQRVVRKILRQIGVVDKPILTIYNKIDQLTADDLKRLYNKIGPTALFVSAQSGQGVEHLKNILHERSKREASPVWISVPANAGEWVAEILRRDYSHEASWHRDQLHVKLYMPEAEILRWEKIDGVRVERLKVSKFAKNPIPHYTSELKTS